MRNLTLNDLQTKTEFPVRRISVYRNGAWFFTTFSSTDVSFRDDTSRFIQVGQKFGLCRTNQNDPSKSIFQGIAGDYIVVDALGSLSLLKKNLFDSMYPKKKETSPPLQNSRDFLNTKYMGNTVENSPPPTSNSSEVNTPTRY
jgi:hypothetical protein